MALKKPVFEGQESAAASDAPAVAAAPNVSTVGAPEIPAANEAAAPLAAVAPSASTAVAAPAKTGLTLAGGKLQPALKELQNIIDPSSMQFNTFRRITVGLDGFTDDKDFELGKVLKVQVLSWNERWVCSPGKQDAESNELVRYSLDGKTIDGTGESCIDYLRQLRETDGYPDAALKKYLAIYGFLVEYQEVAKDGSVTTICVPAEDRDIVSVQIPPMGVAGFTGYQVTEGVKVSQGMREATDLIVLTQTKEKGKTTAYASIGFSRG